MGKLEDYEKQKVLECIRYVELEFEVKLAQKEKDYSKFDHYDDEMENEIDRLKTLVNLYADLRKKVEIYFDYKEKDNEVK